MMKGYLFTFRSITAAQLAAKSLDGYGIANALIRTPRQLGRNGCGYAVRISARRFSESLQILQQEGRRYNKIYIQQEDQSWQEVPDVIL